MDFDMPTDLINQSQIGFRDLAGLSSFNPTDTTLPSPPTVDASISSLDPSPAYLRCKFCQGKLLRGLQSLICIYCGEYQKKDLHPDPISFNSTNAYSWLLQSLHFNGSERVGILAEGIGINGGQSPAEDLVTLSELLDFKISWRDEPKKPENSLASDHASPLNLGITNLDNFFTERIASDASEGPQISSKNNDDNTFGDQENVTLFPNDLPPETSVASSVDDSSDWNAEFQFADTKVENENPKPVDPFVGGEPDLSTHIDAVFGQMEGFNNKRPNEDRDWVEDDLFANMGSATFQQAEKLESNVQEKDGLSGRLNDLSSKDVDQDWFNDGNWQKSSDNLKDKPNDASVEGVSVDWFENADWQKSSSDKKDDNLFDFKPQIDVVSSPSLVNDLNVGSKKSSHIERSDSDHLKKQDLETTDWFQDSQWTIGTSSTTNTVANKDDDTFDEWNDFTSSTGNQDSWKQSSNQDSFSDSWKESTNKNNTAASEKNPELNSFPSTQEVDFGSFSQADMFSGSSCNKNPDDAHAVYNTFSESSTTSRNANAEGGSTPNATTSPENDVQMLLSQMHDLSFMLKSELSIPSKPDDHGPFHG